MLRGSVQLEEAREVGKSQSVLGFVDCGKEFPPLSPSREVFEG